MTNNKNHTVLAKGFMLHGILDDFGKQIGYQLLIIFVKIAT